MDPSWSEHIERIARLAGSKEIYFAHVEASPISGKTTYFARALWCQANQLRPGTHLVHAAPHSELPYVRALADRQDDIGTWHQEQIAAAGISAGPFSTQSFDAVYRALTSDTKEGNLIYVVDLDLRCPADQALALLSLMELAQSPGQRRLAVITMSSHPLPEYHQDMCRMHTVDIACIQLPSKEREQKVSFRTCKQNGVVGEVVEAVASHPQESHLVLIMGLSPHWEIGEALFGKTFAGVHCIPPPPRDQDLLSSNYAQMQKTFTQGHESVVIVRVEEPGSWHFRPWVQGFQNVHVILNDEQMRYIMDYRAGQFATVHRRPTVMENEEIFSSALRSTGASTTVYLCSGDGETSSRDFLETDSDYMRYDVENRHVLGFIASLALSSLDDFGSFFFVTASIQVETKHRIEEMRLNQLRTEEVALFHDLLPAVEYDARLALMLSRRNATPTRIQAKIDLASVLTAGGSDMFTHVEGSADDLIASKTLGIGRELMRTGSLWIFVGLWQEWRQQMESNLGIFGLRGPQFPTMVFNQLCLGDWLHPGSAYRAWNVSRYLTSILTSHQHRVDQHVSPVEAFTEADTQALRQELFDAFLFQLMYVDVPQEPVHSGTASLVRMWPSERFRNILEETMGPAQKRAKFGICCEPLQQASDLTLRRFKDWTNVDPRVGGGSDIFARIQCIHTYGFNTDEVEE
ncbi:hypothetical protein B0I35DRAFT_415668 [Stachybotrys elegans]|uniref:Uncharacterized protein n=1 Tax=Stachybotrys elegans TaxID=80388 RepID=A0A8K0WWT2_9HYPO|nr:hypothetical protein B0I35DRAFT_415668 [Stachybotrys elegans]